jgi:hypothetical protein
MMHSLRVCTSLFPFKVELKKESNVIDCELDTFPQPCDVQLQGCVQI